MVREKLIQAFEEARTSAKFPAISFTLEHPSDLSHGDFASNIALVLGKTTGQAPHEVAQVLRGNLAKQNHPFIESIDSAGPGFINVHLSRTFFAESIGLIADEGERFGRSEALKDKRVMVEYTQPNPFKVFHIGHLMSNAIGESLSRIIEFSGATINRANYQGDVGPHVAKAIWALQKHDLDASSIEDLGKAYVAGSEAYERDAGAREEIVAINRKIYEKSDAKISALYEAGKKTSLDHFDEIYRKLGTRFDYFFFESETGSVGRTIVESRPDVFEKSDGATVFRGERHALHTRVFLTRDGFPTYEAKELGLAKLKEKTWSSDISITVTASEQAEYFKVVIAAMRKIFPDIADKIRHIAHGMMRFSSGKMSSRKGNIVSGESLIEDVEVLVRERMKETRSMEGTLSADVAVAAIKYSILRQGTGKDIVFDPEKSVSLEGDSGPYIQYAHTRAASVIAKAHEMGVEADSENPPAKSYELERLLYRFPEVVARATAEYEPHYLTTYLTQIAGAFNSFYAAERIVDDKDYAAYKLSLTGAFAQTMKNGLWLLGIVAPEKM